MIKKKATKSFADALLSADAEVELHCRSKSKKSNSTSNTKEKASHKSNDPAGGSSYKNYGRSLYKDVHKSVSNSSKGLNSRSKIQSHSSSGQEKKGNPQDIISNVFPHTFSNASRRSLSNSDSDPNDFATSDSQKSSMPQIKVEKTQFVSNLQAGKADQRVAKLLAEEEERQKNAKILQSVDEDLMLYDLHLEDSLKVETGQHEVMDISVLPPGIPFLHSLTCHTLYAPEKVSWPFVPEIVGSQWSSGGNVTALFRWLGSLDTSGVRELILSRTLMDSELGSQVVERLARYLVRYITAHPHSPPPCTPQSSSGDDEDKEVVLAAYELLCYHIITTSSPGVFLKHILEELPLAIVNLGGNPKKFPAATLACWSITDTLRHNKTPNSASDSIAQINSIQMLLNVLSNCLGRLANHLAETGAQLGSTSVSEAALDNLVAWLSQLGQDPAVMGCSLHTSVVTALAHALELYPHFQAKVQDLTEIICSPWLPEATDACIEGGGKWPFPHHLASFVCGFLLADTSRSRQLASSAAFLALSACLECDDYEVLDAVEMSDLVNLIKSRRKFLTQDCDSYTLRSVLLLLDACITHVGFVQPTQQKMRELGQIIEFVLVQLPRLNGGGDSEHAPSRGAAAGNNEEVCLSSRSTAQLVGLRTALLERWEKIMFLGSAVYDVSGERPAVQLPEFTAAPSSS